MSKYCVIVRLSKNTIEFRYQIDNDQVEFLTLNEKEPEIPLAFCLNGDELIMGKYAQERASMNDSSAFTNYFELIKDRSKVFTYAKEQRPIEQLLYIGVERYLSAFLKEKLLGDDWTIESKRKDFPLRFSFASDVANNERRFVIDLFIKAGYRNVAELPIEDVLFSVTAPSTKPKVLLAGLGGDLYMSHYPNPKTCKCCRSLPGIGTDPRFALCAELIFDEIQKSIPWLSARKEDNMELLIAESGKVLQSKSPLYMGNIVFDTGEEGDFQININNLENQLKHSQTSMSMISELEYFLKMEALQPNQVDIVLEGGVNTDYFASRLHDKFTSVFNVSLSDYIQVWNRVFNSVDLTPPDIQTSGENQSRPDLPGLPPINNKRSTPPQQINQNEVRRSTPMPPGPPPMPSQNKNKVATPAPPPAPTPPPMPSTPTRKQTAPPPPPPVKKPTPPSVGPARKQTFAPPPPPPKKGK